MKTQLLAFWNDEEGATAVEYALVVGLAAVAVIAAFTGFKDTLTTLFTNMKNLLVFPTEGS